VTKATEQNNLRFPGQYFDAETGLHYNWHRYYDPSTGRYISADPIGLDGGMNLYLYTGANPVNFIDPMGLDSSWTGWDPSKASRPSTPSVPTAHSGPHAGDLLDFGKWWYDTGNGFANWNDFIQQKLELEYEIPCNEKRNGTVCFTPPRKIIVFLPPPPLFDRRPNTQCQMITLIGRKDCECPRN
jgi:RHS repeat-associated protein